MLRAIIFDFNGVLVNDEPLHLLAFQKVLKEEGISIDERDYYARYLGMDDRGCFRTAYRDRGMRLPDGALEELIGRKAGHYRKAVTERIPLFPGVKRLIPALAAEFPLALASGALRDEIESILKRIALKEHFQVIVSAEDVVEGKPNPEIFLKALSLLNRNRSDSQIRAGEALIVEDSKEGILGAGRAGIRCLAVANSHPAAELTQADAVVKSLEEVSVEFLKSLFS